MKTKTLFIIPLCFLISYATAEEKPKHNYSFVDVTNGLHCTLLNVGPTSFTFSVEWTPDVEFPEGLLHLMGKFDMDMHWWDGLMTLDLNPANDPVAVTLPVDGGLSHGRATFEVCYDDLPWYYWEEQKAKLEQQAFFHLVVPDPNDPGWIPVITEEQLQRPVTTWAQDREAERVAAEVEARKVEQAEPQAVSDPSREEKSGMEREELETEEPAKANHFWFYLIVSVCTLCAILYALRKKRT